MTAQNSEANKNGRSYGISLSSQPPLRTSATTIAQALLGSKSRCVTVSVREYASCVIRILVTALSLSVPSQDQ
jgi:hypothetical protein